MADNPGIAVLILTPEQRRDAVEALTEAIDNANERPSPSEDMSADDIARLDAKVNRWVALINLIEESAS